MSGPTTPEAPRNFVNYVAEHGANALTREDLRKQLIGLANTTAPGDVESQVKSGTTTLNRQRILTSTQNMLNQLDAATTPELSEVRLRLEDLKRTIETQNTGITGGLAAAANTGLDTLQRGVDFAGRNKMAIGIAWLLSRVILRKPAEGEREGFLHKWTRRIINGLGIGALASVALNAMGRNGILPGAVRSPESTEAPPDEEKRITDLLTTAGPYTLEQVRGINLLNRRLRTKDMVLAAAAEGRPALIASFIDQTIDGAPKTLVRLNGRSFGIRARVTGGIGAVTDAVSSLFTTGSTTPPTTPGPARRDISTELATATDAGIRFDGTNFVISKGSTNFYVSRAEFTMMATLASSFPARSTVTLNARTAPTGGMTVPIEVELTPLGAPIAPVTTPPPVSTPPIAPIIPPPISPRPVGDSTLPL